MPAFNQKQLEMFAAWNRKQKVQPLANYMHLQLQQGAKDSASMLQQWDVLERYGNIPSSFIHEALKQAIDRDLTVVNNDRTLACTLACNNITRSRTFALLEAYAIWSLHKKRAPSEWDNDIRHGLQKAQSSEASANIVVWSIWCNAEKDITAEQFKHYIKSHVALKTLRSPPCSFVVEDGVLQLVNQPHLVNVWYDLEFLHHENIQLFKNLEQSYEGQTSNTYAQKYMQREVTHTTSATRLAKRLVTFYNQHPDASKKFTIDDTVFYFSMLEKIKQNYPTQFRLDSLIHTIKCDIETQIELLKARILEEEPHLFECHAISQQLGLNTNLFDTFLQMKIRSSTIEQAIPNFEP